MLFNSHVFLLGFLPLCLIGFHLVGRYAGRRAAIVWLIFSSLFFYGWWNPSYLWILGASIAINYGLGRALSAHFARRRRGSKPLLALGVVANLGLLGYYKYAVMSVETFAWLTGLDVHVAAIALPLGISFFTFQQVAYLVDSFYGTTREYGFYEYCLFVSFFPQLIAGPIVHHHEVLPQFAKHEARLRAEHLAAGLSLLVLGLFKKVMLADEFATYATPVFGSAEGPLAIGFFEAWGGTLAYTLQLYFDFSAYSDMATGLARCFGIRLPINFDSPLKSRSFIDFWQRWHVTLSRFLRDYLFLFLCGRSRAPTRFYSALFLTMVLGGLWHGATWTFALWGALHGVYLLINHAWRRYAQKRGWGEPGPWTSRGYFALTFLLLALSLVPFRAASLDGAWSIYQGMFAGALHLPDSWGEGLEAIGLEGVAGRGGGLGPFLFVGMGALPSKAIGWTIAGLVIAWCFPNALQIMHRTGPVLGRIRPAPAWLSWRLDLLRAAVFSALLTNCLLNLTNVSEFLYWVF